MLDYCSVYLFYVTNDTIPFNSQEHRIYSNFPNFIPHINIPFQLSLSSTHLDINECTTGQHSCDGNATCWNNPGSYSCVCNRGYNGNGTVCHDIDECTTGLHVCYGNATCSNTIGSYSCACKSGYSGHAPVCYDIDECTTGQHLCNSTQICSNTAGSYTCELPRYVSCSYILAKTL